MVMTGILVIHHSSFLGLLIFTRWPFLPGSHLVTGNAIGSPDLATNTGPVINDKQDPVLGKIFEDPGFHLYVWPLISGIPHEEPVKLDLVTYQPGRSLVLVI
jgi:hypothetical protein